MSSSSRGFMKGIVPGLALAGLLLAAALPVSAQAVKPQKGLRVTYLLYSGRPNPSVVVTDPGQVAELEARLAGTLSSSARADVGVPHPVLGYNGIMIQRLDAFPEEGWLVVKDDMLRVEGGEVKLVHGRSGGLKSVAAFAKSTVAVSREAAAIEDHLLSLGADSGVIDRAAVAEARVER